MSGLHQLFEVFKNSFSVLGHFSIINSCIVQVYYSFPHTEGLFNLLMLFYILVQEQG